MAGSFDSAYSCSNSRAAAASRTWKAADVLHGDGRRRGPRSVRGSTGPSETARTGEGLPGRGGQRAVHPAAGGGLQARRAGLHVVLRVEMRARGVGRAHRFDNRQVPLVEERLQRRKRRMQAEEAIEIDGRILALVARRWPARDGDGRAQIVVGLLAVRHHDVQAVGGAALENGHQDLLARRGASCGVKRALQPQRRRACTDHGQGRITKENAAIRHTSNP